MGLPPTLPSQSHASRTLAFHCPAQVLRDIAKLSGSKSQDAKRGLVGKLLAASKGNEPGYIMRTLQARTIFEGF